MYWRRSKQRGCGNSQGCVAELGTILHYDRAFGLIGVKIHITTGGDHFYDLPPASTLLASVLQVS